VTAVVGRGALAVCFPSGFRPGQEDDRTGWALDAVRVTARPGGLEMTATDGFVLARAETVAACGRPPRCCVALPTLSRWPADPTSAIEPELTFFEDVAVLRADGGPPGTGALSKGRVPGGRVRCDLAALLHELSAGGCARPIEAWRPGTGVEVNLHRAPHLP